MRFSRLSSGEGEGEGDGAETVTITIDGEAVQTNASDSVAAAVLLHRPGHTRITPVAGAPRAPLCMMGVCYECLMEIDGLPNQQACQIQVREGMLVRRQNGAGTLVGIRDPQVTGDAE